MKVARAVLVCVIGLLFILSVWWAYRIITRHDPVLIEDTTTAVTWKPRAPVLTTPTSRDNVVIVNERGENNRVRVDRGENVSVAVTVPPDTASTTLLVSAAPTRWLPDLDLVRNPVEIRTLGAGANKVVVTLQRRPVFQFEFSPVVGVSVDTGRPLIPRGFVGAVVLRAWFLYIGGGVSARARSDVYLIPTLSVQIRTALYLTVGIHGRASEIGIVYGF